MLDIIENQNRPAAFDDLCDRVDVDEACLEILLPYLPTLTAIGVNFNDLMVIGAIEGYITHLEAACQCVIGYAGWLANRGNVFTSPNHASSVFVKALSRHWRPYSNWEKYRSRAPQARYLDPYHRGLRLLYEIQIKDPSRQVNLEMLEALSDRQIEQLLPDLAAELSRLSE